MTITALDNKPDMETRPAVAARIVLTVEYDGTRYHGFQLQAGQPTVQEELEKAIFNLTGEKTRVLAASRTDAGVHALGQVVSFRTGSAYPADTYVRALNHYLPEDIAVKAARKADAAEHILKDAVSREYNYYILNGRNRSPLRRGFYHQVPGKLDVQAMDAAARELIGSHDMRSFASAAEAELKNTVKRVYRAGVKKEGEMVVFNIMADSFLMHQVRNTVGPLIRVGQGRMTPGEFRDIIQARQPGLAWPTAPACGLCLIQVNYNNPF